MIELVISGGQTGADQAGWRAAKAAGIATGGWMPKGFLTEAGARPEYGELYGAKEHDDWRYPPRTRANINWCDAMILFGDPDSKGSRLAMSIINNLAIRTPLLVVPNHMGPRPEVAVRWIEKEDVKILNVAGNRESSSPGIGSWVETYLAEVFRLVRDGE
jgi:hypothetical protein